GLRVTPKEEELLRLLVRLSYFRQPGKQFRLASGRMSDYYIECSLTTTNPAAIPLIGALVHARLPTAAVAIGGPTMGADPIAAAGGEGPRRGGRGLRGALHPQSDRARVAGGPRLDRRQGEEPGSRLDGNQRS